MVKRKADLHDEVPEGAVHCVVARDALEAARARAAELLDYYETLRLSIIFT